MDVDQIFTPRFSLDSPYLADYFGLWMVHDQPFRSLVHRLNGTDLHVHLQQVEPRQHVDRDKRRIFEVGDDGDFTRGGGWVVARWGDQLPTARLDGSVEQLPLIDYYYDMRLWSPFETGDHKVQE